jgi:hypothetical protein
MFNKNFLYVPDSDFCSVGVFDQVCCKKKKRLVLTVLLTFIQGILSRVITGDCRNFAFSLRFVLNF